MYQFGLIGHPVSQSKSPIIHNYFLKNMGFNGQYNLYDVLESQLSKKVIELRENNIDGFNVTVPYKEKIIPLLDGLDEKAEKLQSVNTVKREKEKLIGYNTDGVGYLESLRQAYPSFIKHTSKKNILLLGAGGAARGIYYTLQEFRPARLDIANRTVNRAYDICDGYQNSSVYSLSEVEGCLSKYDLIIQTTNIGMEPDDKKQIISLKYLSSATIVSDIVYKPKLTQFLNEAKQRKANLLFGDTMLWYQAAKSFEIWTNHSVDGLEPFEFEKGVI
ncbi:shikimate dehydrogenase [Filobacillus milosensis]|uniref:shikimate dehydrogenase n=1 Tax=Filobacillus milosensis TaxID=94137 RepID=UPI001891511E|nr:shikimate dehydrogenase [Filobacillus milosensis]